MQKNKRFGFLKAAVLCACLGGTLFSGAAEAREGVGEFYLPGVTVEATRYVIPGGMVATRGTAGFLGDKDLMDVPFSETIVTDKAIAVFGGNSQPLDSALTSSPAVRSAGSILHNDFTVRGFRFNGTSMYVNGVHGMMTQFNANLSPFEKVEVLAGPNSGLSGSGVQYESTTAGGVINAVSKKAENTPITRYKQTFSGNSCFGESIDIGRRFGKNNEWGLRINGEYIKGDTSVKNTNVDSRSIYMNLDHIDDKSMTNLFGGYRDLDIKKGMRWFRLGPDVTKLPDVIDGSKDYGFEGMVKGTHGYFMVLNHEQKVEDNWKVFVNAGYNDNTLDKNVMGQMSSYIIDDNDGNFDVKIMSTATPQKAYYAQIGTVVDFEMENTQHKLTVSLDKAWRDRRGSKDNGKHSIGHGNIYTGEIVYNGTPVNPSYKTYKRNNTNIWGLTIIDEMDWKDWNFIAGVHRHEGSVVDRNKDESIKKDETSEAVCPTYAVSYNFSDKLVGYASHAENFDLGSAVPDNGKYENGGESLAPAKTKQNEIGLKYKNNDFMTTLAFYDITQAAKMDYLKDGKLYMGLDGEERHKGVELSFNGKIAPKWTAMVAAAYMDAKYDKTSQKHLKDKRVSGQPNLSGVLGLEYHPDENTGIIGRVSYTGEATLQNRNKVNPTRVHTPAYTVFDLGVTHKTKIADIPAKLSFMCYNVTDKDYWMVARGDQIYASLPRTFFASAEFDF